MTRGATAALLLLLPFSTEGLGPSGPALQRLEPERVAAVRAARERFTRERVTPETASIYEDHRATRDEAGVGNVTLHVLATAREEAAMRASLAEGRSYVAHDWLCDPTGFWFAASNNLGVFEMGDRVPLLGKTRLAAQLPLPARLKLFRNGELVHRAEGAKLEFAATGVGAWRLEAWLVVDGEERPWISSNAIYLEAPSPDAMRLPSSALAPNVEAKKDIVYTTGKPEDEAKHKLDLYIPVGRKKAPVFLFIHGGAWRSGDRAMYAPLGNRFARERILTVAISYRLAPRNPHPAQIEDAAAAFAWVARNIGKYGGDPKRVYVGGHSAGAHLAALLALDARYLARHGLSPKLIKGTVVMSGVYQIRGLESVFGKDERIRTEASPMSHVKAPAPPFLITYCQWDYLGLPLQARRFHAALQKARTSSRLVFIPRQSHISEMVNIVKDDDATARAVRAFMR